MRRSDGFTFIELLVVIVILGILAAVVVFAVDGINDKKDAPIEQDVPYVPTSTTLAPSTTAVALLTCEQLDNAGYDGLASCIDEDGNVVGPGR